MPVRYNATGGHRFWNISGVAEIGGSASPADVKFVQFLLGPACAALGLGLDNVSVQSGQFDQRTRSLTMLVQRSSSNMTADGRVSPMRAGAIKYSSGGGTSKFWTLEALQYLYTAQLFGVDKSQYDQVNPNIDEAMDWLPFDEGLDQQASADMFAHFVASA